MKKNNPLPALLKPGKNGYVSKRLYSFAVIWLGLQGAITDIRKIKRVHAYGIYLQGKDGYELQAKRRSRQAAMKFIYNFFIEKYKA